jgi:hypothetical protein
MYFVPDLRQEQNNTMALQRPTESREPWLATDARDVQLHLCPVLSLVRVLCRRPRAMSGFGFGGKDKTQTNPRAERDVEFLRMQCNAEKPSLGEWEVGLVALCSSSEPSEQFGFCRTAVLQTSFLSNLNWRVFVCNQT